MHRALADAIRARRRELRLTQEQLSQLAGCGTAFLYDLEHAKPTVWLHKLIDVLRVLGLDLVLTTGKTGLRVDERLTMPPISAGSRKKR
jgi:y4mF family transcriptional regulator